MRGKTKYIVLCLVLCLSALLLAGCGEKKSGSTIAEPEITGQYLQEEYSQQLLTDGAETVLGYVTLDKLEEGDVFMIRTLDQTLTYEVDQIRIVLPDEVDDLKIEEGKDLCTLVTCTPYGINTHRLLVRGHRVANREEAEAVRVTADAMQVDNRIVAACIAVPVLLILLAGIFVSGRRKR